MKVDKEVNLRPQHSQFVTSRPQTKLHGETLTGSSGGSPMPIAAHELVSDFPEYIDTIKHLLQQDLQFKLDNDLYRKLDKQIRGLQDSGIGTDDEHYSSLKKQRAYLKQHLYNRITDMISPH
ncbi:YdcH family protein [Microbulbifer epialgicus]|uniref:YdcH family protein n=1 Tax=Microbulbifer epialgicus TaxID=393907 RepID=A0ABV4P0T6_9GAMM